MAQLPMKKEICCVNFQGLISYVRRKYGDEGVKKLTQDLVGNEKYLVADKLDPLKIIPIQIEHLTDPAYWVSNEFSVKLLENIAKVERNSEPQVMAGQGAVRKTFSKSVLFIAKIIGVGPLLKRGQKLNSRFNNTKEVKLVELDKGHALIQLKYFPDVKVTKAVCDWNRGIYLEILKVAGAKKPKISETKCVVRGDHCCEFEISWQQIGIIKRALRGFFTWLCKPLTGELVAEYEESVRDRDALIEKLKASEERYRSVFENTATPTVIVEDDLTITMVNEEFEKISGYSREELEKKVPLSQFLDKDAIELLVNLSEEQLEETGEFSKSELRFRSKGDILKDVLVKVGNIPGTGRKIFSFIDITPRKRMERALRQSEEKHRSILQSIEEGYFEVDLRGRFTFVNDSLCRILRIGRKELLGKSYKDFTTPAMTGKIYAVFNLVFKKGRPVKVAEFPFLRKDGAKVILGVSASLIRNEKGEPIGFRGIMRDVTEREKAKEEKRRLRARLEHAKRMEAIGTLAGGVAHDLNNILSGIVSYPELLLMQVPPDHPLYNPLVTIKNSGEKAATIVQDLLTLARRGVTVSEVINLNQVINDYLNSPEFEKLTTFHPDVQIETRLAPDLLNLKGSPVHISKAIMNLVSNAAEAMPEGGKITIITENAYVESKLNGSELREGDYVVLKVRDTGIGMTEEEKERIFEPFYTKKVMGRSGTGLGMAVVWGTVEDHKGHIEIETAKGKGSTFILYFPATREKLAEKEEKIITIDRYMGKGESILVVDDVKEQREIASEMLRTLKYNVMAVASGEEAVEYIKRQPPDGMIIDMIMPPGMDGLDTYRRVLEIRPGQKAIIVSGFAESERVKEAIRLGAGAYVKKPYSLEKLGTALRSTLDR